MHFLRIVHSLFYLHALFFLLVLLVILMELYTILHTLHDFLVPKLLRKTFDVSGYADTERQRQQIFIEYKHLHSPIHNPVMESITVTPTSISASLHLL